MTPKQSQRRRSSRVISLVVHLKVEPISFFMPIAHSMALEDQAVNGPSNKLQFDLAVKSLLEGSRRELW